MEIVSIYDSIQTKYSFVWEDKFTAETRLINSMRLEILKGKVFLYVYKNLEQNIFLIEVQGFNKKTCIK